MKPILRLMALGLVAVSLCACSHEAATPKTKDSNIPSKIISNIRSEYDDYSIIGEIIKFDELKVHILSGDIVEIYEAKSDESINNLYIGQTVGVKKSSKDIEVFMVDDPTSHFTTMGEQILYKKGTVVKFGDKAVTIKADDINYTFILYAKREFIIDSKVTIAYTVKSSENPDDLMFLDCYDDDSSLKLKVKSITRLDNGVMHLETADDNNTLYNVALPNGCVTNFNYSSLKVDSKVIVYPKLIKEKYPAEVDASMVLLSDNT